MIKKCLNCGIEFYVKPCRINRAKFHDRKCMLIYKKNNPMLQETREKISKTKGGISTEKRICIGCSVEFEVPTWSKQIYHDRQCSSSTIGKLPTKSWKKGLPSDDPKLLQANAKQSKTMKKLHADGEIDAWNKGLTKETDERVAAGVEKLTELRNSDGEWKDNWREAMSKGQVKAHSEGKYPFTFTKPEKLTWAHLESVGYTVKAYADKADDDPENTWYHQYPFEKFVPDFGCPDLKAVIEVNGCYFHGHKACGMYKQGGSEHIEETVKKDRRKYSLYHRRGWKWALVWECEAHGGDFHRIEKYLD